VNEVMAAFCKADISYTNSQFPTVGNPGELQVTFEILVEHAEKAAEIINNYPCVKKEKPDTF
jgi:hypothetical protein